MAKNIYVYLNNENTFLGTVFVDVIRGHEIYSFEYDESAIRGGLRNIIIDPEISFISGRQFKLEPDKPYGFLLDASPDRWGRNLIRRNNKNILFESDYLLCVSDISRMGALRFKLDKTGDFLAVNEDVPPISFIRELEDVAYNYDEIGDNDKWRILLSPGSSLGGARPKATIYGINKELYIAKFSHKNDEYDVSKIEYLTNLLAKECGIDLPEFDYLNIKAKRSVFLSKRFDRDFDKRIHHTFFMTILGASDGESSSFTYLDIAEKILELSSSPKEDLFELFKRVAFYVIAHNYDDHLRNIGMICRDDKWRLSPCFDINIVPFKGDNTIPIDGVSPNTLDTLTNNSKIFGLEKEVAEQTILDMKNKIKEAYKKYSKELKIEANITKSLDLFLL